MLDYLRYSSFVGDFTQFVKTDPFLVNTKAHTEPQFVEIMEVEANESEIPLESNISLPDEIWSRIMDYIPSSVESISRVSQYLRSIANCHEGLAKFSPPPLPKRKRTVRPTFRAHEGFSMITRLYLTGMDLSKDALSLFPNLRRVYFNDCGGIGEILLPPKVEFVRVLSCLLRSLNFLKSESELTVHLHKVGIIEQTKESRLSMQSRLKNVVALDLCNAVIAEKDLSGLLLAPSLRSLRREGGQWTRSLASTLNGLTNLQSLEIGPYAHGLAELVPLEGFTELKELSLLRLNGFNAPERMVELCELLKKCQGASRVTFVNQTEENEELKSELELKVPNLKVGFQDSNPKDRLIAFGVSSDFLYLSHYKCAMRPFTQ